MSLFFSTFHHQTSFRLCSRYSSSSFSKSSSGIKRLSSSFLFVNESERKTFPHRRVHFSRTRMSKRDFGDTKTAATSSKRHQSMTGTEDTIGTHDGSFHCDEALGCYLLQNTQQFSNCRIVRTRDADALAEARRRLVDAGFWASLRRLVADDFRAARTLVSTSRASNAAMVQASSETASAALSLAKRRSSRLCKQPWCRTWCRSRSSTRRLTRSRRGYRTRRRGPSGRGCP